MMSWVFKGKNIILFHWSADKGCSGKKMKQCCGISGRQVMDGNMGMENQQIISVLGGTI